ncbi:hypothetical protein [Mesorhizobium sp. B2-6-2]|uniref:hypothetical protein n=1 Tax=Mesorhizobium sp. B2-6-2 TaxID=2589915 RepID=UPI00112BEC67|nr:hypothetical protein [Mesorhizobium sp. B2-6-2]TPJ72441.1 hypothetical protein FJ419_27990 [Mesorhizobium sp. B2-6-2]
MTYDEIVQRRRNLHIDGYCTLAEVGMEGAWVSPYQISARSVTGPVLLAYHWLDAPSARLNLPVLKALGYLPEMPFNKVFEIVLAKLRLRRSDLYVTQAFHLLPASRSGSIRASDLDVCFDAVTKHELAGRRVIALGGAAANACRRHGYKPVETCHPSARGRTYEDKANEISAAIKSFL